MLQEQSLVHLEAVVDDIVDVFIFDVQTEGSQLFQNADGAFADFHVQGVAILAEERCIGTGQKCGRDRKSVV